MAIKLKCLVRKVLMVAKGLVFPEDRAKFNTSAVSEEYTTPLKPYSHQVGGHAVIYQLDSTHICKPFNKSESEFYRNMPSQLRGWTPEFCFEVELKANKFKNTLDLAVSSPCSSNHAEGQLACSEEEPNSYAFVDALSGLDTPVNPWTLFQLRKSDLPPISRFMVFENLARDFHAPNVLDLKLGTRQYSDNASTSKKQAQQLKCEKSTSKKLGLRMCGLQYFDEDAGTFQCLDKYYGRNLNESEFYKLLGHFFKNRVSDCLLLVEQIEQIKYEVANSPGLRLFGISLLIIVEGQRKGVAQPAAPIARLIDFAHASMTDESTADPGCLLGLENLLVAIKNTIAN